MDGSFSDMATQMADQGVTVNDALDSMETSPPTSYEPMPEAKPVEQEPYKADRESLLKLAERSAEERPLVERRYNYSDGSRAGQKRPDYETVKPERAADDLAATRNREIEEAQKRGDRDLAEALDTLRTQEGATETDGTKAQPVHAEQREIPQPQPVEQAQPAIDPEIAEALSKPKVRAALEEHTRQVETARQAYSQATYHAAEAGLMTVMGDFPEFNGVRPDQLQIAVQMLAKQNPQRHAQLQERIQRILPVYAAWQQDIQVRGQQQQAEYQRIGAEEDARFEASVKNEAPEVVKAVKDNVFRVVESTYGIPKDTLQRLYQTQPVFRHSAFQRLLYDATKFHLAMEGIRGHKSKAAPFVQRPGVSGVRAPDSEIEHSAAWQRLNTPEGSRGTQGLRNAAAYVTARRRAARG